MNLAVCWEENCREGERSWNVRGGEWVTALNRVVLAGLVEKGMLKQIPGAGEEHSCGGLGKSSLG